MDDIVATSSRRLEQHRREQRGIRIASLGMLIATFDAVILRLGASIGDSPHLVTVLFWRMLFVGVIVCGVAPKVEQQQSLMIGPKLAVSIIFLRAVPDILRAIAFLKTSTANAVLLGALEPLFSALGGRFVLGDELRWRTVFAIVCSVGTLVIMFIPRLVSPRKDAQVVGDIVALFSGLLYAVNWLIARRAAMVVPDLPRTMLSGLGALFAAVVLAIAAGASHLDFGPFRTAYVMIMLLNGAVIGTAVVAFAIAVQYITAAMIALIAIVIISIFSPIWVFAAYGEQPSGPTILGGTFLVLILGTHEYVAIREATHDRGIIDDYHRSRRRRRRLSTELSDYAPRS